MAFNDLTDPACVVMAIEEFDLIGRDAFLKKYKFGRSARYKLLYNSKEYDSKPILSAAHQYQTGEPLPHTKFSGGNLYTSKKLRELGFTIINLYENDNSEPENSTGDIKGLLEQILSLQTVYDRNINNPKMVERRDALEELHELLVDECGPTFGWISGTSRALGGDVSLGAGYQPKVCWVRLADTSISPSAQAGWYVVFLFAADGSRVYISLNQGTTRITGANRAAKNENIKARAMSARHCLESQPANAILRGWEQFGGVPNERTDAPPDLSGGALGDSYEIGHVDGVVYKQGQIPEDVVIIKHLNALLGMLGLLYDKWEDQDLGELETGVPVETEFSSKIVDAAERLNIEPTEVQNLLNGVVGKKRQMILMGPPGTGKTFVAQELAALLVEDPTHVRLVQFHPSYGYEDFIEGLRPTPGDQGGFEFKPQQGVLLEMAEQISKDHKTRVLIIDEINRANIPKVFGELMFLLEYRDQSMRLMLDGRDFSLPDNLIIIGTMNTADRSIRTLDVAMRRRFRFFELNPRSNVIRRQFKKIGWTNNIGDVLIQGFEKLNAKLIIDIDRHHTIGHSYLLQKEMTRQILISVWDQEIKPLIEDYFFDRPDLANEYNFDDFWPDE